MDGHPGSFGSWTEPRLQAGSPSPTRGGAPKKGAELDFCVHITSHLITLDHVVSRPFRGPTAAQRPPSTALVRQVRWTCSRRSEHCPRQTCGRPSASRSRGQPSGARPETEPWWEDELAGTSPPTRRSRAVEVLRSQGRRRAVGGRHPGAAESGQRDRPASRSDHAGRVRRPVAGGADAPAVHRGGPRVPTSPTRAADVRPPTDRLAAPVGDPGLGEGPLGHAGAVDGRGLLPAVGHDPEGRRRRPAAAQQPVRTGAAAGQVQGRRGAAHRGAGRGGPGEDARAAACTTMAAASSSPVGSRCVVRVVGSRPRSMPARDASSQRRSRSSRTRL